MTPETPPSPALRISPWTVLTMIGFIFAVSTGDRAIVPLLKTTIGRELGLSNADYSQLVAAFMIPYTLFYLAVGSVISRLGVRISLGLATATISLATVINGTAHSRLQLAAGMFLLGIAQSVIVPAATVAILTLFQARRHAIAYAAINALQTTMSVLSPALVAVVESQLGWRWSFYLLALAGLILLAPWWLSLGKTLAGPAGLQDKRPLGSVHSLLAIREVRWLLLARLISDPFWFFFQFWLPAFLRERLHLSLAEVGRIAWLPPLATMAMVTVFAHFSDGLVRRGVSGARARMIPMVAAACAAPAGLLLPFVAEPWIAISLATVCSALCGIWLSLSAIAMGALVPREQVATGLGVMSAVGGITAIAFNAAAGPVLDRFGHTGPFVVGACLHPIAALVLVRGYSLFRKPLPSSP